MQVVELGCQFCRMIPFAMVMMMAMSLSLLVHSTAAQNAVGDSVCAEGIVMDYFCIARGTLFDNPTVVTLEGPFLHSTHCLLDVPECNAAEYELLLPPASGETLYTRGYRLDNSTKATVQALALSAGIESNYTVSIIGTVVAAADGDTPPTISGKTITIYDPAAQVCAESPGQSPTVSAAPTPAPGAATTPTQKASSSSSTIKILFKSSVAVYVASQFLAALF